MKKKGRYLVEGGGVFLAVGTDVLDVDDEKGKQRRKRRRTRKTGLILLSEKRETFVESGKENQDSCLRERRRNRHKT